MKKTLINVAMITALTATSSMAMANQAGDFIVRAGAINVVPDSGKSTVYAAGGEVDLGAGALTASVDNELQLGLNFVYFATDQVAIELLAATPFKHDLKLHSGDTTLDLGSVSQLPPTLSALYYFNNPSDKFQPYVGAGINYTVFFDEDFDDSMQGDDSALNLTDLKLKNSWGLSAQIGADYHLDDKWLINASIRYIDINTTASFEAIDGTVPGKISVDVDPMVYMISVGYTF